ncbi:MAG TPA: NUDIX domain-containing protein [Actinomycetales bacterium]|jgi:ADP-ribose pyrophosphatase YjhB (NUDIX family)|nr:NUDIX domain-containing protein [Actinomycetales bacterium]
MSLLRTVRRKAYTAALLTFRKLPRPLRRSLVRAGTPSYTVGAVCVVEHDGHMLMLRQPHRHGWSLPGGLLGWGESPAAGVTREVCEETSLEIEVGEPVATQIHPGARRVDVIYRVVLDRRPEVRVGGEAKAFRWMRRDDVPEMDDATQEIMDVLDRVLGSETAPKAHVAG